MKRIRSNVEILSETEIELLHARTLDVLATVASDRL